MSEVVKNRMDTTLIDRRKDVNAILCMVISKTSIGEINEGKKNLSRDGSTQESQNLTKRSQRFLFVFCDDSLPLCFSQNRYL